MSLSKLLEGVCAFEIGAGVSAAELRILRFGTQAKSKHKINKIPESLAIRFFI